MMAIAQRSDGMYFTGYDCGIPRWSAAADCAKPVSWDTDRIVLEVLGCHADFKLVETEDGDMSMKHTSVPWNITDDGDFLENGEGEPIADLRFFHIPDNEANAAFIVRACNSHDELLEALESAAKRLGWLGKDTSDLQVTIAKAKGES